jgi:hypothetical protein
MKYRVYGTVVGSKYLGVFEADTPEHAVELALMTASVGLCYQCSHECEDPEITDASAEPIESEDGVSRVKRRVEEIKRSSQPTMKIS